LYFRGHKFLFLGLNQLRILTSLRWSRTYDRYHYRANATVRRGLVSREHCSVNVLNQAQTARIANVGSVHYKPVSNGKRNTQVVTTYLLSQIPVPTGADDERRLIVHFTSQCLSDFSTVMREDDFCRTLVG
jgi:hypothetical protein